MKPSASADTRTTSTPRNGRLGRTLVLAGVLAATLSACVPLVVGTAVGGAWLALDGQHDGAFVDVAVHRGTAPRGRSPACRPPHSEPGRSGG